MAYEQRDNSGILFRNEDKDANNPKTAQYADAKGRAKIGGVQYWVTAWTKKDKNGNKFQSLSFKEMDRQEHPRDSGDQRRPASKPPLKPQTEETIEGDDIPF